MTLRAVRTPRARTQLAAAAATLGLALSATPALAQSSPGGAAAAGTTSSSTATAPSTGSTASSGTAVALTKTTIKAVQRKLGLKADGAIGARTRAAIRRYQRRHDLDVTGRMDADTLDELGVTVTTTAAQGTTSDTPSSTSASTASAATPTDAGAAPTASQEAVLDPIAQCESGGDPTAVSPSGQYHGKYQFSQATWEAVGGTGDPAAAPEAEQDARAARLLESQGPDAWPVCSQQAPASDDDE